MDVFLVNFHFDSDAALLLRILLPGPLTCSDAWWSPFSSHFFFSSCVLHLQATEKYQATQTTIYNLKEMPLYCRVFWGLVKYPCNELRASVCPTLWSGALGCATVYFIDASMTALWFKCLVKVVHVSSIYHFSFYTYYRTSVNLKVHS